MRAGPNAMLNVANAVSGREKLAGVRRLLFGVKAERLFRQTLSALLGNESLVGPCHLCHVRFKPGHKLTAYYDVSVEGHGSRPVAAIWRGRPGGARRQAQDQLFAIHADAAARGLLAPFRALAAESPGRHLQVQVAPLDLDFPQLVRVFDRRYAIERLGAAGDASWDAPDESFTRRTGVRFIRYRPGLRHLVRYEPPSRGKVAPVFAKLSPPHDSARAFRVSTALHHWLASERTPVTCPRPLAFSAADSAVLYPEVAGLPLVERLRRPSQDAMQWVRRAGEALSVLHRAPQSVTEGLALHDFSSELDVIEQASAFLHALLPRAGATIRALLESARELHPMLPEEPPTGTHGDLKVEHLWVTESGLTVIDFDTCALSDPALDLGTFLADLRVCYSTHDLPGMEEAQRHFLEGYSSGAPDGRLMRGRLYEALEIVKLVARRVQLFDEQWASHTEELVGSARLVMQRVRETLGAPAVG